jgi:hypothetical protein
MEQTITKLESEDSNKISINLDSVGNLFNYCFVEDITENAHVLSDFENQCDIAIEIKSQSRCSIFEHLGRSISTYRGGAYFQSHYTQRNGNSVVELSACSLVKLKNVTIIPEYNLLLTPSNKIVANRFGSRNTFNNAMASHGSYFGYRTEHDAFCFPSGNKELDRHVCDSQSILADDRLYYLISGDKNDRVHAHWFWRVLHEVYYAEPFLIKYEPVLIFSYVPTKRQIEGLLYFFPSLRRCAVGIIKNPTVVQRCMFLVPPDEPFLDRSYIRFLRQYKGKASVRGRKLYISRSDASSRRIINEDSLISALSSFDFERVVIADLEVKDQIDLFRQATHIIYISGSHFTNLAFSEPGSKVCVIQGSQASDIDYPVLSNLHLDAIRFKCDYANVTSLPANHDSDLQINVLHFVSFLKESNFFR